DLLASYTLTNDQFRRVRLVSPLVTETQRGNIRADYRPWRAGGVSATHQDLLAPLSDGTALSARVDGVNAWLTELGFRMNASLFHSTTPYGPSDALIGSVERSMFRRIDARIAYFRSTAAFGSRYSEVTSNFRERINAHLAVSQSVVVGQGQRTVSFGGEF